MREKTELEKWIDKYYDTFGESYPLCMTDTATNTEIIADIKRCIEEGHRAKSEEYEEEAVY